MASSAGSVTLKCGSANYYHPRMFTAKLPRLVSNYRTSTLTLYYRQNPGQGGFYFKCRSSQSHSHIAYSCCFSCQTQSEMRKSDETGFRNCHQAANRSEFMQHAYLTHQCICFFQLTRVKRSLDDERLSNCPSWSKRSTSNPKMACSACILYAILIVAKPQLHWSSIMSRRDHALWDTKSGRFLDVQASPRPMSPRGPAT